MKLQQIQLMLNVSQWLSKLLKKHRKIKGTPPYLFLINNTKNFRFLFTFFKLAVAAPDTMYAPISQKYITAQPNPFQIH